MTSRRILKFVPGRWTNFKIRPDVHLPGDAVPPNAAWFCRCIKWRSLIFCTRYRRTLIPLRVLGLFRGTLCQHLHFRYRLRIWVDDRFLYIPRNRCRTT